MNQNNSRVLAVVSYITWIGWIIAFLLREKTDTFTAHHLNQALLLNILSFLGGLCIWVPHIGEPISSVVGIVVFILTLMGIYRAAKWRTDPLPLVGEIRLLY